MFRSFAKPCLIVLPSRVQTVSSSAPHQFPCKALLKTSCMAATSRAQQDEVTMASNFEKLSIANEKKDKKCRDYSARRVRRRLGRRGQHADSAPVNEHPPGDQPSLNAILTSRAEQLSYSEASRTSNQPASNSLIRSPTILAKNQSEGIAIPPAMSVSPKLAQSESPVPSTKSSVPSVIPSSEAWITRKKSPPVPHATYLSSTLLPATRLLTPQRLLIVLDLNGTLLFRETGSKRYKPRPFLKNFIRYCLMNHVVLIWSSAKPHNVAAICEKLFTLQQHGQLLHIWARDTLGLSPTQYDSKCQVYKNLDRIWTDSTYAFEHPMRQQGYQWSQRNTLLVDDSALKAIAQPYNHVEIPEFVRNSTEGKSKAKAKVQSGGNGDVLGQVTAYLDEASMWDNVSAFVREKKFQINRGWAWDWDRMKAIRSEGSPLDVDVDAGAGAGAEEKENEEERNEEAKLSDEEDNGGIRLVSSAP